MRIPSTLFAGLAFLGMVHATNTPLKIATPTFKDPYSGQLWDTLLDIDIETSCVSNLLVTVKIPTDSDEDEGNANFVGPAFTGRNIVGTSKHSAGGNGPASATVDWDPSTHTLSFYHFVATQATGPGAQDTIDDPWINLNFDIQADDFGTALASQLPLNLTLNADALPYSPINPHNTTLYGAPFINLVTKSHFKAYSTSERCGRDGPGGSGDPVFSGFQGQTFQFHGLPDEHFNLISSPDVQLNSHFVYLSSGKCDYNDTECFTHPGTYMDVLGLSVADAHIKLVAGTHEQGLRLWVNDMEVPRGTHIRALSSNITSSLKYHHNGIVEIMTDLIGLEIVNSDMFMNVRAALNNQQLLRVGAQKHTVTDHAICKTNTETHNHQLIESTVAKKYPVNTPLHGLIGQTWRNVLVCGRNWMGTVQDYMVSDLFASDNHYSYFKW